MVKKLQVGIRYLMSLANYLRKREIGYFFDFLRQSLLSLCINMRIFAKLCNTRIVMQRVDFEGGSIIYLYIVYIGKRKK